MKKLEYIINDRGNKTAIILPVEKYNELLDSVIDFAALAYFNPAAQLLHLPGKAIEFIRFLIRASDGKWKDDFILTYDAIADINGCSRKNIQRGIKDLEEYMKSDDGKAVVSIEQKTGLDGKLLGTNYKLNIIRSIHSTLKSLVEADSIDLTALLKFTISAETFSLEDLHKYNKPFARLIENIKQELSNLPANPQIIKSPAAIASSREY
jgi:hypothetical protein